MRSQLADLTAGPLHCCNPVPCSRGTWLQSVGWATAPDLGASSASPYRSASFLACGWWGPKASAAICRGEGGVATGSRAHACQLPWLRWWGPKASAEVHRSERRGAGKKYGWKGYLTAYAPEYGPLQLRASRDSRARILGPSEPRARTVGPQRLKGQNFRTL